MGSSIFERSYLDGEPLLPLSLPAYWEGSFSSNEAQSGDIDFHSTKVEYELSVSVNNTREKELYES